MINTDDFAFMANYYKIKAKGCAFIEIFPISKTDYTITLYSSNHNHCHVPENLARKPHEDQNVDRILNEDT